MARGVDVIDFGIGEPREVTPAFIPRALERALASEPVSSYPAAEGLPELREAIAGWAQRRFGAALDPDTEVIPTQGSKEAIFHLAQVVAAMQRVSSRPATPWPAAAPLRGRTGRPAGARSARGWRPTSTPSTGTASHCCG
jgi:acetylornithine aminotransferase